MSSIGGHKRADKAGSGKTLLPARTAHTRYNSSIDLRRSSSLTGTAHPAWSRPLTLFSESGKVRLSGQDDNRPVFGQPSHSRGYFWHPRALCMKFWQIKQPTAQQQGLVVSGSERPARSTSHFYILLKPSSEPIEANFTLYHGFSDSGHCGQQPDWFSVEYCC